MTICKHLNPTLISGLHCFSLKCSSENTRKANATWPFRRSPSGSGVEPTRNAEREPQETWVPPLGGEDPLKESTATLSSILAWRIPWTEEPGGLQSTGSPRVTHAGSHLACICVEAFLLFTPKPQIY